VIQHYKHIPTNARDQGPRGTCVAFAITSLKDALLEPTLSPEYAYLATVHQSPGWKPDDGLDVRIALRATTNGLPEEANYPYQPHEPKKPFPQLPTQFPLYRSQNMTYQTFDLKKVKRVLDNGKPLGAIIALTMSFFSPINGVVSFEETVHPGYHAVVISGYGADTDGNEYFLICNSWGTAWGNNGHAWLPEAYLSCHATLIYGEL